MQTQQILNTTSIPAATDLNTPYLFIDFGGNVAGAGEVPLGVLECKTASGEPAPVNTHGILLVTAGGTFSAGDPIKSDANGKAIAQGGSGTIIAYAVDAGTDGAIVRIKM